MSWMLGWGAALLVSSAVVASFARHEGTLVVLAFTALGGLVAMLVGLGDLPE